MSVFSCPVCGKPLLLVEKSYKCRSFHSFDVAKSGYVNLLLQNQMNAKLPGDNKMMVKARENFLGKGFYKPLADGICNEILQFAKPNCSVFDAGCGEGYYTTMVDDCLTSEKVPHKTFGIDISKSALGIAAKRSKSVSYAVGSLFHLPITTASCDIIMTLFAPYCGNEFLRILSKNGIMAMVIPGQKHLWSFKKAIYDNPYENAVKNYELDGFDLVEKVKICNIIELKSNQDIQNLFSMTPYFYKTSVEDSKKVLNLEKLTTETEFEILVYKKR
ncbi:MAG: methyltransferase domain-containing protein [Oscillospiraceae bacterium]